MPVTRVGIVGASLSGGWALQSHVPALLTLPGFEIVAVSTTRLSSAERTAQHFGIPNFYDSTEALAADPLVDLVSVTVKIPDHEAAVSAAIAARKNVYCEWPLGVNTVQAADLRDRANAAGIQTVIGLQARATPTLRFLRDLLVSGYLGDRILSVHASSTGFGNGGPILAPDREWAADDANGLSALTVRTAHTLDAVQFCVGSIETVLADVRVATPFPAIGDTGRLVERTAPDQVPIQGSLAGGGTLTGRFLLGVRGDNTPLLTIHGTNGTIIVAGEGDEPQIQIASLRLLAARRNSSFEELAVPRRYIRTPQDLAVGAPSSVAENYLSMVAADAIPPSPGFNDAVALHMLLDLIRLASVRGERQVAAGPQPERLA